MCECLTGKQNLLQQRNKWTLNAFMEAETVVCLKWTVTPVSVFHCLLHFKACIFINSFSSGLFSSVHRFWGILTCGALFPSVSRSFSSPGPYYICLIIGCVSNPAEKFNTSLKTSAKPESFCKEQKIKGTLAWGSCWLIYWSADSGWLLVCLTSFLFSGGVFACDVWKHNGIRSFGCEILWAVLQNTLNSFGTLANILTRKSLWIKSQGKEETQWT